MWLMYALFAAIAFGLRGVLYHKTSTLQLDRNLMLSGVFASGVIINGVIILVTGAQWSASSLVGIQMGLFSFAASACMYKAFAVGKASIVAILSSLQSVVVVVVAYLLWDEKLHAMQLLAFLVLIIGVVTIRYSSDISLSNMQGAQWALLTMLFFAGNDLSGKWSTMLQAERYPTMFMMFTTGTLCFAIWWLVEQRGKQAQTGVRQASGTVRRYSNRSTFVIGLGVGITNAVGMIFILQSFELGKTGLVSAVIAMNVVIILLYTRFVVRERLTKFEVIGMIVAICGILLIHLFR